ncbi:MAG TPA: fumarylacetoacetate hydrolase family protein [Polyangiaceae bacterium]|jgi:2-keto-4-pentenoate hydratase/2-oxohepta-3-ene-1,7-dioic acid hydratase in catechol pathway|nr:fumarylacetoacetate hydrolase family protein [Polyangiaceae bacterium]
MRYFVRAEVDGEARFAELRGDQLKLWSDAPWLGGSPIRDLGPIADFTLLCPVIPSKIIGIGRNYRDHAKELGGEVPSQPLMFLKPPSSLNAPGKQVVLPAASTRVDFEGELAVIIGQRARRVSTADALNHVFGFAAACDVTARDLQKSDGQWTRAKGFDTFCPISKVIASGVALDDIRLTTTVNGVQRQSATPRDMVFSVPELVSYASGVMTLEPGDLILTGTPEGVGPMQPGDEVSVEITPVGKLSFTARGPED